MKGYKSLRVKEETGITLVALIITIIVLIILAAVTIISVTESGLVDRTIRATEEYAKAQERENTEMGSLDDRMSSLTSDIKSITGGTGTGEEGSGGRKQRRRKYRRRQAKLYR